jgi:hypothetical protein
MANNNTDDKAQYAKRFKRKYQGDRARLQKTTEYRLAHGTVKVMEYYRE